MLRLSNKSQVSTCLKNQHMESRLRTVYHFRWEIWSYLTYHAAHSTKVFTCNSFQSGFFFNLLFFAFASRKYSAQKQERVKKEKKTFSRKKIIYDPLDKREDLQSYISNLYLNTSLYNLYFSYLIFVTL